MTPHPDFAWLKDMAFNCYSQFGEDGILQAIFSVIRPANEWCFECGASDGLFFSNTRRLIEQGWHGILVEADYQLFKRLVENSGFGERVQCTHHEAKRIDSILDAAKAPDDIDLVVIDVDGQDYFLFNSILKYRPRVVMVEFDPVGNDDFIPTLGGEGQAGCEAIRKLGEGKLYDLVACTYSNAIFVQQSIARLLRGRREDLVRE